MKPPALKRRKRDTINTGIGRFKSTIPRSLGPTATLEYVAGFCIYPELSQDITNEVNRLIDQHRRLPAHRGLSVTVFGFIPETLDRTYGVHMEIVESHLLLRLSVSAFNRPKGREDASWRHGRVIGITNLRLTTDGLIADFYDDVDVPKYNPANCVTILNQDESEFL